MLYGPFHLYHICGYVIKVHERMHNVLRGKKGQARMGKHGQHIIYTYENALRNLKYTMNIELKIMPLILLNLFSFKF